MNLTTLISIGGAAVFIISATIAADTRYMHTADFQSFSAQQTVERLQSEQRLVEDQIEALEAKQKFAPKTFTQVDAYNLERLRGRIKTLQDEINRTGKK